LKARLEFCRVVETALLRNVDNATMVAGIGKCGVGIEQAPLLDMARDPAGRFEQAVKPGARHAQFALQTLGAKIGVEQICLDEATGALCQLEIVGGRRDTGEDHRSRRIRQPGQGGVASWWARLGM
jgi:hypothetical protein